MTAEELTVRAFFAALDAGDIARVLRLFTEDVRFRFGNAEPTLGPDGLTLPCLNVFRLRHGLIADYRVYMDINPLLSP